MVYDLNNPPQNGIVAGSIDWQGLMDGAPNMGASGGWQQGFATVTNGLTGLIGAAAQFRNGVNQNPDAIVTSSDRIPSQPYGGYDNQPAPASIPLGWLLLAAVGVGVVMLLKQ